MNPYFLGKARLTSLSSTNKPYPFLLTHYIYSIQTENMSSFLEYVWYDQCGCQLE